MRSLVVSTRFLVWSFGLLVLVLTMNELTIDCRYCLALLALVAATFGVLLAYSPIVLGELLDDPIFRVAYVPYLYLLFVYPKFVCPVIAASLNANYSYFSRLQLRAAQSTA